MTSEERARHSERMTAKNPMQVQTHIDTMAAARRATGQWRPPVRGGNGTGLTVPQTLLLEALGPPWVAEYAIPTRAAEPSLPNCYKVDLAHPTAKIAVEVDGETHKTKLGRERDAKKDRVLNGLGWRVLRFSNREILQSVRACALEVSSTTSTSRAPKRTSSAGS